LLYLRHQKSDIYGTTAAKALILVSLSRSENVLSLGVVVLPKIWFFKLKKK